MGNTHWCGNYDTETFISNEMCCACAGGCTGDDCNSGNDSNSEQGLESYQDLPFTLDDFEVAIEVVDTIKSDLVTGDS